MPDVRPTITYATLVGRVILQARKGKGLDQRDLANALGITQSAYSRLELGESSLSLGQVRTIATALGSTPGALLQQADGWAVRLAASGVTITDEKKAEPGAAMIALGILLALVAAGGR